MEGFGDRLRQLRHARGYTMDNVSKMLGVARSTYAGYESEFRHPSLNKLKNLSQFYNVSVDYILGLSDDDIQQSTLDAKDILKHNQLHWEGIPLSEEDLEPIRNLLHNASERRRKYDQKNRTKNTNI